MTSQTLPRSISLKRPVGKEASAVPFVLSVFIGALLIFLVQPMFAKMATPLLGGSPSVWNVSLVCFQAALLLGYSYAHLLARMGSVRLQVAIHFAVFAIGAICLPLAISDVFGEPNADQPTLWLIGVFAVSIALPFAAVSATAPLVQSWYARSGRADAGDPYHLYAASNIGSLIGLAAYPLLLEPFTRVATQSQTWAVGYGVLLVLLMVSGWSVARRQFASATTVTAAAEPEKRADLSWRERAIWLGLAFIPSSLLVGATSHITTDVAATPFLWVPPLALYLLTFVFVFSKKSPISLQTSLRFTPLAIAMVLLFLPSTNVSYWLEILVTLFGLFMAAMACHGLLAERRPHVSRLTEFYLLMSVGGVLGGAFNALLAPLLFDSILEYPIVLLLALLVLPATAKSFDRPSRIASLLALGAAGFAVWLEVRGEALPDQAGMALLAVPVVILMLVRGRRFAMAFAFLCGVVVTTTLNPLQGGEARRGFFGVVKSVEQTDHRVMMHGTTVHGAQMLDPEEALRPLTYYAPETPIGQAFSTYREEGTYGVVGLGVGSVACYAKPGQDWVFYEIDPIVVDMAKDPSRFTFLSECQPDGRIETGDARIKLAHEAAGLFDLLLLDAFSSDAIPAHLVTREAMALYLDKLAEDGVFVAHISNRHIDLEPVFAGLAEAEGAVAYVQRFKPTKEQSERYTLPSNVMVFARSEAVLEPLLRSGLWEKAEYDGKRLWTDDYSNILGAMLDHSGK